ncbi:MAG: hypothetical protein AB1659_12260 [Thermodesulfobacteriota bacterium]
MVKMIKAPLTSATPLFMMPPHAGMLCGVEYEKMRQGPGRSISNDRFIRKE